MIGSFVFARRLTLREFDVRPRALGTPTPTVDGRRSGKQARTTGPVITEGSWVLSALPGCFDQKSAKAGASTGFRPTDFPLPSERLGPGAVVRRADCTIVVGEHDLRVFRGEDRLRVPPEAALYRSGERLTLVWEGNGRTEVRDY